MIKYIKGDLFEHLGESKNLAVIHCCNNIRQFEEGFAATVAEQFPVVKERFLRWGDAQLGACQSIKISRGTEENPDNLFFLNMIGQSGIKSPENPVPVRYDAIETCLKIMTPFARRREVIFAPKFGSGLAGGDWKVIEEIINRVWFDINLHVFEL